MEKIKKIVVSVLIILFGIMICNTVQAFDVFREDAQGVLNEDEEFIPNTNFPGGTFFCIKPGGEFHVKALMSRAESERYPVGTCIPSDYQCVECNDIDSGLPWTGYTKYFYRYKSAGTFSYYGHPDAAYVLAEMTERGDLLSMDTAYGIWNSSVSSPKRIGNQQIVGESQAYKVFYETIHGGLTTNDIFKNLIYDNTGNVKIGVNQQEGSYTVGPFNIDYPNGIYDGQNKFSWIESMQAVTDAGTLPVEILLPSGEKININDLKEKGNKSLDGKDFYIKFYSKEATSVSLKVEFGYLEHCDAEMTKYIGHRVYRYWERKTNGKCNHPYQKSFDPKKYNGNGDEIKYTDYAEYDKARYEAKDDEGKENQPLMALSGTASKVRKKVVKYFPQDNAIDLTMKMSGIVFLDQDTGKVNVGNNRFDRNLGEALPGVEVTLCDENGNKITVQYKTNHIHTGDQEKGTGCYTTPVYHVHSGSDTSYGGCYTQAIHTHIGNSSNGGAGTCYQTPVYHTHNENCYEDVVHHHIHRLWCYNELKVIHQWKDENNQYHEKDLILKRKDNIYYTKEGKAIFKIDESEIQALYTKSDDKNLYEEYIINEGTGTTICGKTEEDIVRKEIICGKDASTVEYYLQSCGQEEKYNATCGKTEKTIEYYELNCNKTINTIEKAEIQGDTTLTNSEGFYEFNHLNAMKKYYIKFTYNGMLYTNVKRLQGNADDISKATEEAQDHNENRQSFNDLFSQVGSYPQNYKIRNKVFGNDLGDYNKVYLQEEVADLFKQVASKFGDVSSWKNADEETKRKVQFVVDCRISAYTTEKYPLIDIFTIDYSWNNIAGQSYDPIYSGPYSQLHINLGIKARPTFDLSLYKDVFNATLNINGKQEVYTYDARKDWQNEGFSYGVKEDYYLNELRNKYIYGTNTNITTTEVANEGEYLHEYRTEEIINGNNQNQNYDSWLKNEEYLNTLYGKDSNKQYAWRDINHTIKDTDKLQIHITYKIAIRNQSNVIGSVTEIVDYYDSHYQFEKAYMGDKDGNEIAGTKVDVSEESMYGEATKMGANGQWTVGFEKLGYKTIYLRPTQKKLTKEDKEQYIYVTFGLINPEKTLIDAGLPKGNRFYTYNLAEINGYKTYGTDIKDEKSLGLIDRDSNPGNFNPSIYEMGKTPLEDDTSKAPAFAYSIRNSRTLEGNVFEDALSKDATASKEKYVVNVAKTRFGNGTIDDSKIDKKIQGIKVELVEIKDGQLVVRQTTYTDKDGWYGFGAFLPGDYTIRFTYGAEDKTALTTTSQYSKGLNDTSYNGQDYSSTVFTTKQGETLTSHSYKIDTTLQDIYNANNKSKNSEEKDLTIADQIIKKYERQQYYWFDDPYIANKSDAEDDLARRAQVVDYSKKEYGKEITNHKAEVFNSYINQKTLREAESKDKNFDEQFQAQPMEEVVDTSAKNRELVNELERRTYMYAYTPEIKVEVEYTTKQIEGNLNAKKTQEDKKDYYEYKIIGVDFGVVERPRQNLTLDQDVKHIKVTAADGTTLLEMDNDNGRIKIIVDNRKNYQWLNAGKLNKFDQEELINIILDDELLSGAKLEVTYNITVTNNSETGIGTSRAKTIINYVANNLNFDLADNNGLWEAVKKEDIQTTSHSTFINNALRNKDVKLIDLTTQTTVLKATVNNPLTKALKPGESATSTLTLKKTLSAESSADDLSYSNMSEIVEIDNTVGRYDHGAIPGNQSLEEQPREHDTSGASRYDELDQTSGTEDVKKRYPPDGKIIVTPPTGSKTIYYVLGISIAIILTVGIILIKKFVIRKK